MAGARMLVVDATSFFSGLSAFFPERMRFGPLGGGGFGAGKGGGVFFFSASLALQKDQRVLDGAAMVFGRPILQRKSAGIQFVIVGPDAQRIPISKLAAHSR